MCGSGTERASSVGTVVISDLQPNNWYICQRKLDRIRRVWDRQEEGELPPVLVTKIDGRLSLIDGHCRTFVALEHGRHTIPAIYCPLTEIDDSSKLYEHIHREGAKRKILHMMDLSGRVVSEEDYVRLWLRRCQAWEMLLSVGSSGMSVRRGRKK